MTAEAAGQPVATRPGADERPVLAVNAGSSSLKFGLYGAEGHAAFSGEASGLEPGGRPVWRQSGGPGRAVVEPLAVADGQAPIDAALARLQQAVQTQTQGPTRAAQTTLLAGGAMPPQSQPQPLLAVAHRIVHGGARFTAACALDDAALADLATLNPLAPLHQPHNLAGVAAFARHWPQVPQVGCFDTAFHATLLPVEQQLPLPAEVTAPAGLRRFGFHGLSYQYLAQVLAERSPNFAQGRALLAHLGNGASVCGTLAGRSVATSMGFSALDGLMMGTRCGALDPGVLLHLLAAGWSHGQLETLLYKQSGLKGVSGLSADMRTLRASTAPAARAAIDLFTHRLVREAGAVVAVLGGVQVLAFTGGIGEHDALLRADVCRALGFLGITLNEAANRAAVCDAVCAIHAPSSAVEVWVVPTDEGRVAAQAARTLLG